MWSPPDERWVRAGLALFLALTLALSVVRSLLFRIRHGVRPVAPPRTAAERTIARLFPVLFVVLVMLCVTRLAVSDLYRFALPWRAAESNATLALAVAVMLAGGLFAFVAQSQMGRSWRIGVPEERTRLVTSGIYGSVRNPIYTGFLGLMAGLAILLPSLASLAVVVVTALVIAQWVRIEEARQLEMHRDEFRAYCERTGRFFPRLR